MSQDYHDDFENEDCIKFMDKTTERAQKIGRTNKTKIRTIDLTPTWEDIVPVIEVGLRKAHLSAQEELVRMAKLADQRNEIVKELKEALDNAVDLRTSLLDLFDRIKQNKI